MALPWVRLDSNIASHDKVLALLSDPSSKKWQAFTSYACALGWSGGQGTDGYVPQHALVFVHGTAATARLLVKYRLWEEGVAGWQIVNYAERQELTIVTEARAEQRKQSAEKANCTRWHGPNCWKRGKGCGRDLAS